MKIALILFALLFFAVAALCLIGSIVLFVMARRRNATAAVSDSPQTSAPTPAPVTASRVTTPASPRPDPPHTPSPIDTAATLYVPLPETAMPAPTIIWLSGPLQGERVTLTDEGAYIGREAGTARWVIESPSVSKRHAWVGLRNGKGVVSDPGSTNGTFLAVAPKQRISEHVLTSGDVVILADDVARFRYEEA